jgi:hypothetical protein
MIRRASIVIPVLMFFLLQHVLTQPLTYSTAHDSSTLAANPKLQASGFHRFLFGSLWREAWTTPVRGEILRLDSNMEGLYFDAILSRTHQDILTHSLLLKDKDRIEYTFTPLDQDSASSLPSELSILLPRDIVEDQISTLNPFAPLIIAPILEAVGLPYRETRLVILSGNEHLSGYQVPVDGKLGILQGPWCFPSTDIKPLRGELVETSVMLESLESNLQYRIDELQYLKARFIDILLGNWDRTADQWQWFKVQTTKNVIWKPVPYEHRQVFVRFNGLLPTIADITLPQLEHCGKNISNVENLTLTGRALDRRLLITFSKQTWDSLASWLQAQINDSIIIKAITRLPHPILEKEGELLVHLLQDRRMQLLKAADEFYKLSSAYVDISGSNKAERAEIRKIGRHMVSVTLYDHNDTVRIPVYQRLFLDDFTKEIRVLLLGGDDRATVEGEETSAIKIIVDGGDGINELVDKSKSRRMFTSINLFSSSGTFFYDGNPASRIIANSSTTVFRDWPTSMVVEKEHPYKVLYRNWGSEWSFSPWLDINPDDGLFIGGGPVYTQYSYRMEPYAQQIEVRAGLATRTGRYRFDATGDFRDWFGGIRTFLQLHASQLDLSNFFGLGNETRYSPSLENTGFYKVDQRLIFLHAALDFSLTNSVFVAFGSTLRLIDHNPQPGTLLHTLRLPYYNKSLTLLIFSSYIQTDTRNDEWLPTRGLYAKAEISYLPKILDNDNKFFKFRSEVRTYYTPQTSPFTTIALRATGEKIWGNHPFFESAFIGGNESLRGFERQRFAGDASLFGGVELRTRLAQIPFLVPLWIGFSAFAETGRVFLESEQSTLWHNAIGGGVWFSIIKPDYIANLSLARSEDQIAFYATLGFMF